MEKKLLIDPSAKAGTLLSVVSITDIPKQVHVIRNKAYLLIETRK